MRPIHGSWARLRGHGWMLAAPALALVVAACTSAAGAPAYTYPPPASPPGSAATGMNPSASPMAMPTMPGASVPSSAQPVSAAPASTAPDSTASAAPIGATLHIAAQNIQFDTDHLAAPAGEGWVLEFANNDAGVPHNVEILDASGASVFKGAIVTGPTTVSYQVPALPAGSYRFLCDVHPTMTGTLTVG
jgi:plastocyanin